MVLYSVKCYLRRSVCSIPLVVLTFLVGCASDAPSATSALVQPTDTPTSERATATALPRPTPSSSASSNLSTTLTLITQTTTLAPIEPLQTEQIIDRPMRPVQALTSGDKKYRIASWGPETEWIAAVPQDGSGLDVIHARTGEVMPVVTDTYVLEPLWLGPDALIIQHDTAAGDHLVRYTIGSATVEAEVVAEAEGPMRGVGAGAEQLAFTSVGGELTVLVEQPRAVQTVLPFNALITAPAPRQEQGLFLAINPLVTNLQQIQTLVVRRQADTAVSTAISEVGEGLWLPRWSPDASKLALTTIGGRIVTSTIDGSARYDLGPGDSPAWGPDSTRVAFVGTSAGTEFTSRDVHVVDWQGQGARLRLTRANDEQLFTSPSWSTDGTRIAFVEIDSGQLFIGTVPQE